MPASSASDRRARSQLRVAVRRRRRGARDGGAFEGVGGSGAAPCSTDAEDDARARLGLAPAVWSALGIDDAGVARTVLPVSIFGAISMWRFRGGTDPGAEEVVDGAHGGRAPASTVEKVAESEAEAEAEGCRAVASAVETVKVFALEYPVQSDVTRDLSQPSLVSSHSCCCSSICSEVRTSAVESAAVL